MGGIRSPARTHIADHLLVLRCQAGDEGAFTELFGRFGSRTHAYLTRLLEGEADDANQEVWLGVYRRIGTLANPAGFRTWLFQVTRNHGLDVLRNQTRRQALLQAAAETAEADGSSVDDEILRRMSPAGVEAAMESLSLPHHEVVHLRFWEDMSYTQIALVTGQPVGTVRSRLHHAKKHLQSLLTGVES